MIKDVVVSEKGSSKMKKGSVVSRYICLFCNDKNAKKNYLSHIYFKLSLLVTPRGFYKRKIRLNKTGMTTELAQFFSDPKIEKVGVGIRDDIKALQKLQDFDAGGFIELQTMATEKGLENHSLKKLAGILLHFKVSKRQRISNWEAEELTKAQITYAATDAWVALEIYKKLQLVTIDQFI